MSCRDGRRAAVPIAVALLLLPPLGGVASARGARFIELLHNTSGGGNRLDVNLMVKTGTPYARCTGSIALGRRGVSLPKHLTGAKGGAQWRWEIAPGAPAGHIVARVRCRVSGRFKSATSSFAVREGPPARARSSRGGFVLPGSMSRLPWTPPDTKHGSGAGGSERYPNGQCTNFVASLRPDLPFFPDASGDARSWATSAAAAGWPVDQTPQVGDVVVFRRGQHGAGYMGHVAYVTAVEATRIQVIERNWHDDRKEGRRTIVDWSGLDFIHRRADQQRGNTQRQDELRDGGGGSAWTPPAPTFKQTTGGPARTWSDYRIAGGDEGPQIPAFTTIDVSCRVEGYVVPDGNPWWYLIASYPWSKRFYVTADAFFNGDDSSSSLRGTPFVDTNVPIC